MKIVGDRLMKNGAILLKQSQRDSDLVGLVLAIWGNDFVTWFIDEYNNTINGVYFSSLDKALDNYTSRCKKYGLKNP